MQRENAEIQREVAVSSEREPVATTEVTEASES
jgi:hypothetical protein